MFLLPALFIPVCIGGTVLGRMGGGYIGLQDQGGPGLVWLKYGGLQNSSMVTHSMQKRCKLQNIQV